MFFRFPVRRFLQSGEKTETPQNRVGAVQWVLARALYRFKVFDLAQVPAKNRAQALRLELTQWTPFAVSAYYVGWIGETALVWGWDSAKVNAAITAQGLKPQRTQIFPETVLQAPHGDGLCLSRSDKGFDGQLWRKGQLERSRWWAQLPAADDWLMFQRDAGIAPTEQQGQAPSPRVVALSTRPWIVQSDSTSGKGFHIERSVVAAVAFLLAVPTFWYGFSLYKVHFVTSDLRTIQAQLKQAVEPVAAARVQSLDHLARWKSLHALAPYPEQLALMAKIAQALPPDRSYVKEWDFKQGQLKVTLVSSVDISTTVIIGALQQAGPFRDVKSLPGRDLKSVTFQMDVAGS